MAGKHRAPVDNVSDEVALYLLAQAARGHASYLRGVAAGAELDGDYTAALLNVEGAASLSGLANAFDAERSAMGSARVLGGVFTNA